MKRDEFMIKAGKPGVAVVEYASDDFHVEPPPWCAPQTPYYYVTHGTLAEAQDEADELAASIARKLSNAA